MLNGKPVANSGATALNKGDVTAKHILVECKTLTKPKGSHTIKREWMSKNEEESFAMGKTLAALCFDFGDGCNYYIISEKYKTALGNIPIAYPLPCGHQQKRTVVGSVTIHKEWVDEPGKLWWFTFGDGIRYYIIREDDFVEYYTKWLSELERR